MVSIKRTQGHTHHLRYRSLVGFFIIGLFILASQFITQSLIVREASSSRVINLAGRQRMLSQRIVKDMLILHHSTDLSGRDVYVDELSDTLQSFEQAKIGLQQGSNVLGLPGSNSRVILTLFELIEADYEQIVTSAQCILDLENNIERSGCTEDSNFYLQTVLDHEDTFLSGMDTIVFQYDAEVQDSIQQLRNFSYLATLIGGLSVIGIWFGVVRSAIQKVELSQTQLRQQADVLAVARDNALQASSIKSQILMNISHDARTPLSSIILSTDMLRKTSNGSLTEKQLARLDTITLNAKRLNTFLQNFLDQAKLEVGGIQLVTEPIALDKLSEELDHIVKPLAEHKGLTWQVTYAPDFPSPVYGDHMRLIQILINLGHNAIKFTDQGDVSVHFFRHDEQSWGFHVKDTGQGINPETQKYIFDKFWQADGSAIRRNQSGVGLGLSIVYSLVELMGGNITVTSELGQGTLFVVLLPILPSPSSF